MNVNGGILKFVGVSYSASRCSTRHVLLATSLKKETGEDRFSFQHKVPQFQTPPDDIYLCHIHLLSLKVGYKDVPKTRFGLIAL